MPTPSRSSTPTSDDIMLTFDIEPDEFGLFCSYISCPMYEPDKEVSLDSICDMEGFAVVKANSDHWWSVFRSGSPLVESAKNPFAPFLNATVFCLMNWFYSSSNVKSVTELNELVNEVMLADDFDKAHLNGFNATRELKCLNEYEQQKKFPPKDR
jgi:hypothetical protein